MTAWPNGIMMNKITSTQIGGVFLARRQGRVIFCFTSPPERNVLLKNRPTIMLVSDPLLSSQ